MNRIAQVERIQLIEESIMRRAEESLFAFVQVFWNRIEGHKPFLPNWHFHYLAEYLEAITAGQLTRLVVNLPPRHGKSLLVCVFWPVWEWLRQPNQRWMFVSGSESLASQHSRGRRQLLLDPDLLTRYPDLALRADHRSKAEFQNVRNGLMQATSFGSSLLGKGGNRIVLDDPETYQQAASQPWRERNYGQFRHVVGTRADDKLRSAIVLIQQRLHPQDLSGFCERHGFTRVSLPALQPEAKTFVFPRSGRQEHRVEGQPLWPERESVETLATQRNLMGSIAFNAQYQQAPDDPSGAFFRNAKWGFYSVLPEGRLEWYMSFDLSFKGGTNSDYVVGLIAARHGALTYLVDRFKAKLEYPETKKVIADYNKRYPQAIAILVEDAANGTPLVQELTAVIPGIIGIRPQGSKEARAAVAQAACEAGQVLLPRRYEASLSEWPQADWVPDFIENVSQFPHGRYDDDVDALSQLLLWLSVHPAIEPASFGYHPDPDSLCPFEALEAVVARRRASRAWIHRPLLGWPAEPRPLEFWAQEERPDEAPSNDVEPIDQPSAVSYRRHRRPFRLMITDNE